MKYLYLALFATACGPAETPRIPVAPVAAPALTSTPNAPFELAISDNEVCVLVGGRVHCGDGDDRKRPLGEAPAIEGVTDATTFAIGRDFGCAITKGRVLCWGRNESGQLGAGVSVEESKQALAVKGVGQARALIVGPSHACAIVEDGRVACWGNNEEGQTGASVVYESAAVQLNVAKEVPGVHDATEGTATSDSTCVLTKGGSHACWGRTTAYEAPHATQIPPGAHIQAATFTSGGAMTCATTKENEAWCWGRWPGGAKARVETAPVAVRIR